MRTTKPQPHPRADDRLLTIGEVAERIRLSEQTIHYKRHRGGMTFMFRQGNHLVAWERDVLDYLEGLRLADAAAREGSR